MQPEKASNTWKTAKGGVYPWKKNQKINYFCIRLRAENTWWEEDFKIWSQPAGIKGRRFITCFFFLLSDKVIWLHCLRGKSSRGLLTYSHYALTVCGTVIGSSGWTPDLNGFTQSCHLLDKMGNNRHGDRQKHTHSGGVLFSITCSWYYFKVIFNPSSKAFPFKCH